MNWSSPIVIGLSIFIGLLVVIIVGSAIAAFVLSGRYKKWRTKTTTTTTTSTKSSGWFWKLVIWVVVIGVVCFVTIGVIRHKKQLVSQVTTTSKSVTDRKWEYGFMKVPGVNGLDPNLREDTYQTRIIYYDRARFDFEVYLPKSGTIGHYYWLRSEKNGTFSQPSPPNRGIWFLKPDPPTSINPTFFRGWEMNTNGEWMQIWLRAID